MKLWILAFALVSIAGSAAAQELKATRSNNPDTPLAARSSEEGSPVLDLSSFPARPDGLEFARPINHKPSARWNIAPLSAGCYTLRVYKVKRTESVKDGESASRGYSTCEPGLQFQVRTAIATDHSQAK